MGNNTGLLGQLQNQSNYIGNALGNIGNLVYTGTSSNVATITSGTTFLDTYISAYNHAAELANPIVKREPTEIEWLRKRVDEVLWKEAA